MIRAAAVLLVLAALALACATEEIELAPPTLDAGETRDAHILYDASALR